MAVDEAKRPVRVADCSGANCDPGEFMFNQANNGPIDAITGDYLAEINLANNAEAYKAGKHPGYEQTALDGFKLTLELINKHKIKVVLNAGALNPAGLAKEVKKMIDEKGYDLTVAYVVGDNLMDSIEDILKDGGLVPHLDELNPNVKLAKDTDNFVGNPNKPIVSANAYLGARAIKKGLDEGADLIMCGRVADASPVIGIAQWWHQWSDTDFDQLAGGLVAGHLIECSAYATGANFSGFEKYATEELENIALPIAEIHANGDCVITKHPQQNGFVTEDTIRCQLLYEIQGEHYLNSCVKADLKNISIKEIGKDRVFVSGTKGLPPPPTTKLAVFYKGGYQCEMLMAATGTPESIGRKFEIHEYQIRNRLRQTGQLDDFDILEFQRIGVPETNPKSQIRGTTQVRIFAQSEKQMTLYGLLKAQMYNGMQHYSGAHGSMDFRTALPKEFLTYYPGVIEQARLQEGVHILDKKATADNFSVKKFDSGHPSKTEPLAQRVSYEPTNPVDLSSFGETISKPLGDIVLARSGDKGANVNIGLFVHTDEEYDWLRSLLTSAKMKELIGDDWTPDYYLERVEFPNIKAVHFVVYGPLGRGISSTPLLDGLGKGFADYIRAKYVDIPARFLSAEKYAAGML
ncbi:DUF1446-domain-containing protein [Lophium mytilinum]|uniref:DUF1446-domain-containing protein n=1 Tax=Lophium mytilinum TaxID=390894 RepID=A0A6A6QR52_9PEZI|nr:DUF1446-domain-containing protein [Lophium mytilinum]